MKNEKILEILTALIAEAAKKSASLAGLPISSIIGRMLAESSNENTYAILSADGVTTLPDISTIKLPADPTIILELHRPAEFGTATLSASSTELETARKAEEDFLNAYNPVFAQLTVNTINFLYATNDTGTTYIEILAEKLGISGQYDLYPRIVDGYLGGVLQRAITSKLLEKHPDFEPSVIVMFTDIARKNAFNGAVDSMFATILSQRIDTIVDRLLEDCKDFSNLYDSLYTEEDNGMFKIQNLLLQYLSGFKRVDDKSTEASYEFNNRYENQFRDAIIVRFAERTDSNIDPQQLTQYCAAISSAHAAHTAKKYDIYRREHMSKALIIMSDIKKHYSTEVNTGSTLKTSKSIDLAEATETAEKMIVPVLREYHVAIHTGRRLSTGEEFEVKARGSNKVDETLKAKSHTLFIDDRSLYDIISDFIKSFLTPKSKNEDFEPSDKISSNKVQNLFNLWKAPVDAITKLSKRCGPIENIPTPPTPQVSPT
jgi:hypothetical protein